MRTRDPPHFQRKSKDIYVYRSPKYVSPPMAHSSQSAGRRRGKPGHRRTFPRASLAHRHRVRKGTGNKHPISSGQSAECVVARPPNRSNQSTTGPRSELTDCRVPQLVGWRDTVPRARFNRATAKTAVFRRHQKTAGRRLQGRATTPGASPPEALLIYGVETDISGIF
jgi:hypothetical protein